LEQNDHEFGKTRVIGFSQVFKICAHDLDDQTEEQDEDKEDGEERDQIEEYLSDHLNQEAEVVYNSHILHDLDYSLCHANN
jgi:hypothetical protein